MDFLRGVFNAPVSGIYHFSFSGIKDSATSTSLKIQLLHNYEPIGLANAPNLNNFLGLSTINVSLKLQAGDNVALLKVGPGTPELCTTQLPNTTSILRDGSSKKICLSKRKVSYANHLHLIWNTYIHVLPLV